MAHEILIMMGATGTGKSALALEIAKRRSAVIINADAMQLVGELRVITARPTDAEMAQAEHALYGVLSASEPTSVARWLALAEPVVRRAWVDNKLPMLVGGTGMYLQAMMDGLARVPPIPQSIRDRIREESRIERRASSDLASQSGLYAQLVQKDPLMAAWLKPGDTQRIARALEVIEATGLSLAQWQQHKAQPLFPQARYHCFHLELPRAALYARLDARFEKMMAQDALDEVQELMKLNLSPELPITRAHGVPELSAYLRGDMALEAAIAKAQQNTRNYAKRQLTWLRNQMPDSQAVDAQLPVAVQCDSLNYHLPI